MMGAFSIDGWGVRGFFTGLSFLFYGRGYRGVLWDIVAYVPFLRVVNKPLPPQSPLLRRGTGIGGAYIERHDALYDEF